MAPAINFVKAGSSTSRRGYHFPKNVFRGNRITLHLDERKNMTKYFLSDNGRIFSCKSDEKGGFKFYEVFFQTDQIEYEKKLLPFNINLFEFLVLSNDFHSCIAFRISKTSVFAKKSVIATLYNSNQNLLDSDEHMVGSFDIKLPLANTQKLLHCNWSPSLGYVLLIWLQEKKLYFTILHLKNNTGGKVSLDFDHNVDITTVFPGLLRLIRGQGLDKKHFYTESNQSETFFMIKILDQVAVYSIHNAMVFTIHPKRLFSTMDLPTIIEDVFQRTFLFCSFVKEEIEIFELNEMELSKLCTLNLSLFGILPEVFCPIIVQASPRIMVIVVSKNADSVYLIDPFKQSILKTFGFEGKIFPIKSNFFGKELFVWHAIPYPNLQDFVTCVDMECDEEISLKSLAKRSVLSNFSVKQLRATNLPNVLRRELGVG